MKRKHGHEYPKSLYLRGKSPDPRHHVPIAVPVKTAKGSHGGCPDGGRFSSAEVREMERGYLQRRQRCEAEINEEVGS